MIHRMREDEEKAVRRLYEHGHPTWPERPAAWFTVYPTLVAVLDGELIGYTSFAVGDLTGMRVVQGADLVIDLSVRGAGIGMALHRERLALGAEVGARWFSGITQPNNAPMIKIFTRCGHHACQSFPRYYADAQDGVLYAGPIGD